MSRTRFRLVVVVAALVLCGARALAQQEPIDTAPPTPIEQALMEHACRTPGQAMAGAAIYEACLQGQLTALRTDFGPELKRLTTAERRTIDAACTKIRTDRGRDAYVACLSEELIAARTRRAASAPEPAPTSTPIVVAGETTVSSATASPLPPPAAPETRGTSPVIWMALAVVALAGASGAWLLRQRQTRPHLIVCRQCGADIVGSGELCATCRHEAADAQRRAVADREERQRALAEDVRRAQEEQDARQRQTEEEARREEARAREAERVRAEEAARQRDEELRRWQEPAAAAIAPPSPDDEALDAYAVLGVTPDATPDEIEAAYRQCREKYDPDQVSDLGPALQDHYRQKTGAVERAYEMLKLAARSI